MNPDSEVWRAPIYIKQSVNPLFINIILSNAYPMVAPIIKIMA